MVTRELTASVFIVRQDIAGTWQTALIWHPRLECWLPAGGHVEADETAAHAAVREAAEETGLAITLVPAPALPFPAGFPHQAVPAPWWTAEFPAAPDNHTRQRHVHVDHVFAAVPAQPGPGHAEHKVRWFTPADLVTVPGVSPDSQLLAASLLECAQQAPGLFRPAASGEAPTPGSTRGTTGSAPGAFPTLVVIRGNSASGKSAAAAAIRARHAPRDLAIVSQDTLRRDMLREHDIPGGANISLLELTARHAANSGFHVIVEGILRADHYGTMLTELISGHPGPAFAYYLNIPFDETLLRHGSKPQATEYGEAEMRDWYRERDLLPGGIEHVIPASHTLEDTVGRILADTGLGSTGQD
jgi:ADP-ribose pyrophosphatase YjhB (NUDIX family)